MNYDSNNVFAKILRAELPSNKVFENDVLLCFYDANPVAKTHVLIIPKGEYIDYNDFIAKAPKDDIVLFFKTIPEIAKKLRVKEYRLVSNCGKSAGQIVFHFHIHLIAN
ncbi:MAG: HIT domain-containing protein [Rickettsiales bacterium]|nr:HIT domain-containing protein [Rickettsiales bacterium]